MELAIVILIIVIVLFSLGYWSRRQSHACPASLSWLVENPYMQTVASPSKIFGRIGLADGMKVLDVGAGPGRLSLPAAQLVGNSGEVVALDLQAKMLEKLRAHAETQGIGNIRLINVGAGSGALVRDYFDRALLVTVLGEIPNKHEALAEIYHALKPGGILSITELMPDPHYLSRKTVRSLCSIAGFREVATFGTWFAFSINFMKPMVNE
jgi:ubiquinone/menaquinone biosynthesis C-methylase UbiE